MINTEDCYLILDNTDEENLPADDYIDLLFESVAEAERYIEKQGDEEEYRIISLIDFIEEL